MPKYTITIADIDLYINTEESPEMVEKLVETVDRRVRSITSVSPRLSKSEAAILCAVDYCADKLKGETQTATMEQELKKLAAELEQLKAEYAALSAETDEVRRENRIMNDLISKNLGAGVVRAAVDAGEQLAIETSSPETADTPIETVPATDIMFDNEHAEEAADAPVADPVSKKTRRSTPKNKVGDMFDMLTFKDV